MSKKINHPSSPKTGDISQDTELLMLKSAQCWTNPGLCYSNHGIPQGQVPPILLLIRQINVKQLSRADPKTGGMLTITDSAKVNAREVTS